MKIKILFLAFFLSISVYAHKHNHSDKNEIRYIKNARVFNQENQQFLRQSSLWSNFTQKYNNWYVIFNECNQLPHRAFGSPIYVDNFIEFLEKNNFIIPDDVRVKSTLKSKKYTNVIYTQFYNGLEVINSEIYSKFDLSNQLVTFGLDIFNDINVTTIPKLSSAQAAQAALTNISEDYNNLLVKDNLKILAVPHNKHYKYHLIYEVYFSTRISEGPANYLCYVDAHNGELLMRKNTVLYEAPPLNGTATVSGSVYPTNPYNNSSNEKFKYLKSIDQATNTNYFTDVNGEVFLPLAIGSPVRYKLEGQFADVETNGSTPEIFQNLSSVSNVTFDNFNSTIQERTAYWAVNEIHDHLKTVFPTYTGLDNPMQTNIDVTGSCNAYYDGSSINFYAQGGGCHATANLPDVVYHEYGHAINNGRYNGGSGMWNGGLNEGYADIWALSLTEIPVLGYGWDLVDPNIFVRRYDQDIKVYPQDLVGEVHADGEIIAGAFWDLYLNLGSMSQMLDLFKSTYDSGIDGPNGNEGEIYTDILLEVLYADDNDADLSNGTPNDNAIVDAFNKHGITLLSNAVVTHTPVINASSNTPISINANISLTYPWALSSANCYYRLNNSNSWNVLNMNGPINANTNIPPQQNGTVIAYYLSLTDNFGNESGVNPIAANLDPIKNANLPYFIMIGFDLVEEEDFDANFGFWQTGGVDDNATTGIWEIGAPIPSYGDPNDPSTICQTDQQHTIGGLQCAFTGNASSVNDGLGTNDVDGGHTTLYSPYYDLTNLNNPAFSYFRWYTNSPYSGANPGADWWQVMITNDGVNWHYVEDNISSDISWRKFAFRVSDYVTPSNNVQIKFIASDSIRLGQNLDGGSLIEAAVDDLYLYEAKPNSTEVVNLTNKNRNIIKITDLIGRELDSTNLTYNKIVIFIYDDGHVERKTIFN